MYRTIEVEPVAGALGAEVAGVDLAGDLSDETVAEIRAAWLEHLVLFFRGQERLGPDAFMAFARRIGEPVEYPFVKGLEGYPEIIAIAKLPHETVNFGGIWHSDTVYLERPPMGTLLIAREVPPYGGDTMWANMYAAYEALSPGMQHLLDGLRRGEQQRARRRVEDPRGPHRRQRLRQPAPRRRSTCRSTPSCARTRRPGARRCT